MLVLGLLFLNVTSIHYPNGKNPEYSRYRQNVTDEFALLTALLVSIIVVVGIPTWNYVSHRSTKIVEAWSRLNLGRWLLLNQVSIFQRLLSWIFFHSTSIFQLTFWLVVLCPLLFSELNDGDLIFLAKRLGKLPVVCLPTILFLTIRPSPLPNVLYLSLLPIHKWISRIVIIQSVLHVILYLGYFQHKHTWFKLFKLENNYGWAAFLGFLIIMITSIGSFRERWYRIFYFNHYIWSWIIVICLQFHARPVKVTFYTCLNVIILVGQVLYRWRLTRRTKYLTDVQVIDILPQLSLVEFPNEVLSKPAINPGAHVRIAKYSSNVFGRFYQEIVPNYHPYTLVSLPLDQYQKLIVKKGNFKLVNDQKYLISGTYDPHLLFMEEKKRSSESRFSIANIKSNANRLLIVVGGSAISFAIPIIRVMSYHGLPVKVVWVVRDFRDVVVLNYFSDFIQGDDFEIFITGKYNHNEILGKIDERTETEGVEIAIDDGSEDEGECCSVFPPEGLEVSEDGEIVADNEIVNNGGTSATETDPLLSMSSSTHTFESTRSIKSKKSSRRSSISSNPFEIPPETSTFQSNLYRRTLVKLNLVNKIYQGRPTLNHRYHQWCTNESNFTQCSGPIAIDDNTFICCRDVPVDKHGNDLPRQDGSAKRTSDTNCWVVSAGPKNLVRNTGLWARESGLKFHEESFFV